jgi:hypothetical protein
MERSAEKGQPTVDRSAWTCPRGQGIWDKSAVAARFGKSDQTGQLRQFSRERSAGKGLPDRSGLPGQNRWDKSAGACQTRQVSLDRSARKVQPKQLRRKRSARTGHPEKVSPDRSSGIGQPGQVIQKRSARTVHPE